MKDLINMAAITANTKEEVYEQVMDELRDRGYFTANNESDVYNFFVGLYPTKNISDKDILTREIQRIKIDGVPQKYATYTYIPTITVRIFENYMDSGSCDYVYTVNVTEE